MAMGGAVCVVFSLAQGASALAQDTVYIGGSGEPNIEVNLDVLNDLYGAGDGRRLLHPWEKPRYLRRNTRLTPGRDIIHVPVARVPGLVAPAAPSTPPTAAATPRLAAPPAGRLPQSPSAVSRRAAPAPLTPLTPLPGGPTAATMARNQERLAELAALRGENLITAEDYAAKRAEIMGEKTPALSPLPSRPATLTAAPDRAVSLPSVRNQERLTELAALRDKNLITPGEYAAKREKIIGKITPAPTPPPVSAAPPKPPVSVAPAPAPAPTPAPTPAPVQAAKPKSVLPAPIPVPGAVKTPPKKAEPVPEKPAPEKPAPPAAAKAPEPAPEPVLETAPPAKKKTRVAALSRRSVPAGAPQLRLDFKGAAAGLTPAQNDRIRELAARLKDGSTRLQVRAYAGTTGEDTGSARRASLKRALAVRSRLIDGGIRSTRIDVRALGMADDDGPADRVDIFTVAR
jgi:outer membrane protein OmpA-like peptidoglycan-associated protein